ncbi:hypothetical protein AB4160_19315, partial [Shewanella sp. 10N.286.51.B8]|uniref:hypothetical protein n=1 Tax=Shewanella sp. 10N.286.51.B8 TaxID=3229708 RepID=UPI00354DED5C
GSTFNGLGRLASQLGWRFSVPLNEIDGDFSSSDFPSIANDLFDRLVAHLVQFCRFNTAVISHQSNPKPFREVFSLSDFGL